MEAMAIESTGQHRELGRAVERFATTFDGLAQTARHGFVPAAVARVTVYATEVEVVVNIHAVRQALLNPSSEMADVFETSHTTPKSTDHDIEEPTVLQLRVPSRLLAAAGEKRMITADNHRADIADRMDEPMIKAIARAHRWAEQLLTGKVASVHELARSRS